MARYKVMDLGNAIYVVDTQGDVMRPVLVPLVATSFGMDVTERATDWGRFIADVLNVDDHVRNQINSVEPAHKAPAQVKVWPNRAGDGAALADQNKMLRGALRDIVRAIATAVGEAAPVDYDPVENLVATCERWIGQLSERRNNN